MSESEPEHATIPQLEKECQDAIKECLPFLVLTRDAKMQKMQRDRLLVQKERIRGYKRGAAHAGREDYANYLFGMQASLNAYASYLDMLRLVKSHDFHGAWNKLIDTEEYIELTHKAAGDHIDLSNLSRQAKEAERTIFPSFTYFSSWGVVIRGGKCTVCGNSFSDCEHAEGKVYWGKLCVRVQFEVVKMDHMAYVTNPRDRRCITTEVSDNGKMHEIFTWKTKGPAYTSPGAVGTSTMVMFNRHLIEID
ncbi:MAG TPA: hypothetical protein VG944_05610 [Fimbriimonas sp.]|nr:hypothetical protein [Fimbriimonas sp.]